MPDPASLSRADRLREEFQKQAPHIHWHELQTNYAHGSVIRVAPPLDLVEVAVQLGMDNTDQFQAWISAGHIAAVNDAEARAWFETNPRLRTVVAAPWVLVQNS